MYRRRKPAWPLARFPSENTSNTEKKRKEPRGRGALSGLAVIWGRQPECRWWVLDAVVGKATVRWAHSMAQARREHSWGCQVSLAQSTQTPP